MKLTDTELIEKIKEHAFSKNSKTYGHELRPVGLSWIHKCCGQKNDNISNVL